MAGLTITLGNCETVDGLGEGDFCDEDLRIGLSYKLFLYFYIYTIFQNAMDIRSELLYKRKYNFVDLSNILVRRFLKYFEVGFGNFFFRIR